MFGEHTWGFDAKNCPRLYGKAWEQARAAGQYARLEESWGEKAAYIRKAADVTRAATASDLQALARAVGVKGPRIVVFNPLPWPRDGVATLQLPPGVAYDGVKDAATGRTVPCQQEADSLSFLARDVPAMGYRTYVRGPSDSVADPRPASGCPRYSARPGSGSDEGAATTLENAFFRLKLDPARGVVASLVDKRSGRELVDAASPYGLGQYVYERFDADEALGHVKAYCGFTGGWVEADFAKSKLPPAKQVPHVTASPRDFALSVRRGPCATVATMRAATPTQGTGCPAGYPGNQVPHGVVVRWTLWADQPHVDVSCEIIDKRPDPWPEACWLAFPLKIERPQFRLGRLGSVTDPARDIRRSANFDTFCLNTGLNVLAGDGRGVGLCPIDSPLVGFGYRGLYRYTRSFEPREPVVFVNLYANMYGTNFQQWAGGTWSSRVRLWSVDGKKLESDLITPAWEARSPFQTALCDGPAGKLPPLERGIELSRKGVLVTALGPNPDGGGTLLRMWEQAGEGGVCRVCLPESLRRAVLQPCDLRGRAQGKPIAEHDGRHEIPLAPFAPASFLLNTP